jgi:hypothetical protein
MKLAIATLLVLTGCAANPRATTSTPPERMPTADEVAAYVRAQWAMDYGERFARFEQRQGEKAELIAVSKVACVYYYLTPECSFDITARFADGERQRQLYDQFGWTADGRLEAVMVMYHERRR